MSEPLDIIISSPPVISVNLEPLAEIEVGIGGPEGANSKPGTVYLAAGQTEPKLPGPFVWLQTDGKEKIKAIWTEGIV